MSESLEILLSNVKFTEDGRTVISDPALVEKLRNLSDGFDAVACNDCTTNNGLCGNNASCSSSLLDGGQITFPDNDRVELSNDEFAKALLSRKLQGLSSTKLGLEGLNRG